MTWERYTDGMQTIIVWNIHIHTVVWWRLKLVRLDWYRKKGNHIISSKLLWWARNEKWKTNRKSSYTFSLDKLPCSPFPGLFFLLEAGRQSSTRKAEPVGWWSRRRMQSIVLYQRRCPVGRVNTEDYSSGKQHKLSPLFVLWGAFYSKPGKQLIGSVAMRQSWKNEPMNCSKWTKIYSGVLFHVLQWYLTNCTTSCGLRCYLSHGAISSTTTLRSCHGLLTTPCMETDMGWTTQYTIKCVLDPQVESEQKPQVFHCVLCVN